MPVLISRLLFNGRPLRAGIAPVAAIAALAIARAAHAAAPQPATTLVCTNPAGHVSWRIRIDFAAQRVDSNPARISGARITWHDRTDGRTYTLDRRSGDLTVAVASSTGGYFIHDVCAPDRPLKPRS